MTTTTPLTGHAHRLAAGVALLLLAVLTAALVFTVRGVHSGGAPPTRPVGAGGASAAPVPGASPSLSASVSFWPYAGNQPTQASPVGEDAVTVSAP